MSSPRIFTDLYVRLIARSWLWLLGSVAAVYLCLNATFAGLYLLAGDAIEGARPGSFIDAFFFSVQTMATIGYGKLVPRTVFANALVTVEALVGLLGVAMVTGLLFQKFSHPTARVLFSRRAVVSERDGVRSFMFRMANERGNGIVKAEAHVVLAYDDVTAEGERVRRFEDLQLSRRQNAIFALSWTVIHPIDERSPLRRFGPERLRENSASIIVTVIGFDETVAQSVHARYEYAPEDVAWGARFADIVHFGPDGERTIDYRRFHDVEPVVSVGSGPAA